MQIEHIILCVDDDQDDLDMLRMVIENSHETYRMETALNGAEALQKLEALKALHKLPCLIVLDMNMPKMNGKETLKKIKSTYYYRNIPIIIFSTASKEAVEDFYTNYGAEYLTKPMEYQSLYTLVDRFAKTCSQATKLFSNK